MKKQYLQNSNSCMCINQSCSEQSKYVCKNINRLTKLKIHFGMRVVRRIVACENLETLVYFLKMAKEMLTTELS